MEAMLSAVHYIVYSRGNIWIIVPASFAPRPPSAFRALSAPPLPAGTATGTPSSWSPFDVVRSLRSTGSAWHWPF